MIRNIRRLAALIFISIIITSPLSEASDGDTLVKSSYIGELTVPIGSKSEVSNYKNIKYRHLTKKQKAIYSTLLKNYRRSNKTALKIRFYDKSYKISDFVRARDAFNNQLLRYTSGLIHDSHIYSGKDSSGRFFYQWTIDAYRTRTRMKKNVANRDKLKRIADRLTGGMTSTREKVIAINNYVCRKLSYRMNAGTLDMALNSNYSKCTGYSALFMALCEQAGIKCVQIIGRAGGEAHAWNQVRIGSRWYYVDPTWNDARPKNKYLISRDLWPDHSEVWARLSVINFQQCGYSFGF